MEIARRIGRVAAAAGEAAVAGLTLVLVVLVAGNVVARYVFNVGVPWVDEMVRLLFVWVAFGGAWAALHRGRHLAVVGLVDRLAPRLRGAILLGGHLLVMVFLVVVFVSGWDLVQTRLGFGTVTPALRISVAWGYVPLPVSAALMLLEVAASTLVVARAIAAGESLLAPRPTDEEVAG
jgi:TRAP-type C4-dicarboxylate transport system permease small subunit